MSVVITTASMVSTRAFSERIGATVVLNHRGIWRG